VFHYVSASPWQLYPALAESLASAGFPAGTLHLREFRVRDNRRWNLLASPRAHKLAATGELFARFPGRRFVLVGDTGESDPEVYGELARRHPRQVAAIALRQLPNTWSDSRRRRALARVGARIILFSRPDELSALGELR
jgi:phosphatidate phosphatase APP1